MQASRKVTCFQQRCGPQLGSHETSRACRLLQSGILSIDWRPLACLLQAFLEQAKAVGIVEHIQDLAERLQSLAKAIYETCLNHASLVSPAESLGATLQAMSMLQSVWHHQPNDLSCFSTRELHNILLLWALYDPPADASVLAPLGSLHNCLRRRGDECDDLNVFQDQLHLLQVR